MSSLMFSTEFRVWGLGFRAWGFRISGFRGQFLWGTGLLILGLQLFENKFWIRAPFEDL